MPKRALSPDSTIQFPKAKKIYKVKFNNTWLSEFPWLRSSSKSSNHAFCVPCNTHFSIAHSGHYDIMQHSKGEKHSSNTSSTQYTRKVQDMFKKQDKDDVLKAEVLFTAFVAEHNIPFLVADHFTKLVKEMFPDSDIAKKFSCMRTKTTHIMNRALAPSFDDEVTKLCQNEKFSVMIDESNDQGDNKSMAVLVRVYDQTIQRVSTKFLGLPTCNIATAENLFQAINQVFVTRDIQWSNCIGYSSDNCNVMTGKKNSVLSRVREQNPNVFDLGCVCHLANLCVQAAVKTLPLPVEDLLIDIYFHFFHSSKRKELYKEYQIFTETDPLKIIKHCTTRWLSLDNCISRLLQQWPALKSYFASHSDVEKPGRVQRCRDWLMDPEMVMYYKFLQFILPLLNDFNTTFQADAAMIGHLHKEMYRLLRRLMGKFVLTRVIAVEADVTKVDYANPDNQHDDSHIAIGIYTRTYIAESSEDIPESTTKRLFKHVRLFYKTVVDKMLKKFSFSDSTLKTLGFHNPDTRDMVTPEKVLQLAQRFPPDIPASELDEEIQEYLLAPKPELPDLQTTLDNFWVVMSQKKLPTGKYQYSLLSKVAIACLSIAHSNADPERTFSMHRKIQTDCRHNLSNETISSLLSVKINSSYCCYDFKPSRHLLKEAKSVCNSD